MTTITFPIPIFFIREEYPCFNNFETRIYPLNRKSSYFEQISFSFSFSDFFIHNYDIVSTNGPYSCDAFFTHRSYSGH